MGIADDFAKAFLKSQLGGGVFLPAEGTVFVSVKDSDKSLITPAVRAISELGFRVIATGGTADYLKSQGIDVGRVNKVAQGRPHIVDKIKDGEVDLIFNTTEGWQSHKDSASIRASAVMQKVPYFTTAASGAWIADFMLYLFGLSAYLFSAFLMMRVVSGYRALHREALTGSQARS